MSVIEVKGLNYTHLNGTPALYNVDLDLPAGSRTLLIGGNGVGKSTLLQILAGKRMVKGEKVAILGHDVFRQSPKGVTFLGTEWASNPVVRSDIVVASFLDSVGGYRHKERRDRLLRILDVDLDWHMHQISDGERRRVQLVMGLMAPWDALLLDEVTVDLDVLVRDDLLVFLKEESETRGATILYATHIFDGLDTFPTHVAHMRDGAFATPPALWNPSRPLQAGSQASTPRIGSNLHALALSWLREDRELRLAEEKNGKRAARGPKASDVVTDSEAFYKKYDYSH